MGFIEMPGLGDVQELPLAPEGTYDLCIIDAQLKNKDNKNSIMCILQIENADKEYASIFHYVGLPSSGDDKDKTKAKNLFAKRFFVQFSIPTEESGFDIEAMVGCRATNVKVTQGKWEGRMGNNLQIDRIPEEGAL